MTVWSGSNRSVFRGLAFFLSKARVLQLAMASQWLLGRFKRPGSFSDPGGGSGTCPAPSMPTMVVVLSQPSGAVLKRIANGGERKVGVARSAAMSDIFVLCWGLWSPARCGWAVIA